MGFGLKCILKTSVLTTLCVYLLANLALAQRIIPRFETLSVNDGLSQNSVYSIHQDKKGFMWFGTSNGLNRYDGENIEVFKIKSQPLEKANINFIRGNICEDKQGRIWYANETGIYFFDPLKEDVSKAYDFMPDNSGTIAYYSLVCLDENENLWLSHPSVGLLSFSTNTQKLLEFPFPDILSKTDFDADLEHIGNSILFYEPQQKRNLTFDIVSHTYQWLSKNVVNAKIISDGKYLYNVNDYEITPHDTLGPPRLSQGFKIEGKIMSILKDQFDRIWITTLSDGLYSYHPDQNKIEHYRHENSKLKSLPFDIAGPLFLDNANNLWIGTDGGGVARLDLKSSRFEIFPLNQGDYPFLKDYFIRCLYEDEQGRVWFGTQHSGFCIYDPKDETLKNFSPQEDKNSLPANKVNFIFRDAQGTMFIAHSKGLSVFNEEKNKFTNLSFGLYSNQGFPTVEVFKLLQLQSDDILVITSMGVFILRKMKGVYEVYKREIDINSSDIIETSEGNFWMTTRALGLNHFTYKEGEYVNKEKFFVGINLRSIHLDKQNPEIIWICSGAGLIRFNVNSYEYKLYNQENGIPDNYLYGVLEDNNHNLWISSNTGIYFFDRTEEKFVNYTFNDGLQSNEFNSRAFYEGTSGQFYFGGINGFNYFDPGKAQSKLSPPKVSITTTWINDQSFVRDSTFVNDEELRLKYFENDLAFSFAVLDYTRPEANKIQYKLDGWDENFTTTHIKNARYSNLPPGKYTLHVRGANTGQIWSEEETLRVNIEAPFWKTDFFYGGVILIVIGSVVSATRAHYKQKIKRKLSEWEKQHAVLQERERISKDMHDDLGSGLSTIAILSELAIQRHQPDTFTEKQLRKISELSRELIANSGELIWSHNPINDSLLKLFWYMREHLSGMFEGTSTLFTFLLPDQISDKPIQAEWRRNVFLVTKEALHNVLKHAHANHVEMKVLSKNNSLTIVIRDDGVGFEVNVKMNCGNGLGNMNKRIKACGGELKIESNPGSGTLLTVIVPMPI